MIAILTYDAPHRKTQDLLSQLLLTGRRDISIVATPWVSGRSFSPVYTHRPSVAIQVALSDVCRANALPLFVLPQDRLVQHFEDYEYRHVLIAGAGLLPAELVTQRRIINAHPGYLPYSKGLDAFKWALYYGRPIGVTTHYVSAEADEGMLIARQEVPLYAEDTFHSAAYRVYETEISLLRESMYIVDRGAAPLTSLADDRYVATRRMPRRLESEMMTRFEALRKSLASRP